MYLDRFVHSSTGKILMSISLGLGLATFFRAVCRGQKCKMQHINSQTMKETLIIIFFFHFSISGIFLPISQ